MKSIRIFFLFGLALMMNNTANAQKKTFSMLSYTMPKGWQQQQNEGGVQLSVTDKKTGAYAMAIITAAAPSSAAASENFNSAWNNLVKTTVQLNGEIAMGEPANQQGWDIVSGGANYTDAGNTGMVTLLTATGGGQTMSVVLLTNTKQYQNDLLALNNSFILTKAAPIASNNKTTTNTAGNASLAGLWVYYTVESSGYANGMPVPSGGYLRKEYTLNANGTYVYRLKYWGTYTNNIQFAYETGTWSASGNKITITPKQGKCEWWNKAGQKTSEWGSLQKKGEWKLEPVTYTFELHYYSGMNETDLILTSNSETQREGTAKNNSVGYSPRPAGRSLIDNPPGFKSVF